MKEKVILGLSLILLAFAFSLPADAEEIRISAAASLLDAVKEVSAAYRENHPDSELLLNFASSGALARQITAGAPADIYISANPKWMQFLRQQRMIAETSQRVLLKNSLVFVGMPGTLKTLAELPKLQRIALGSPKSTPVGRYAEQALSSAGLYVPLLERQALVLAKDVRQALLYADRGEVDGAFVYRTDALRAKRVQILFSVPQELFPQVVYPAALTKTGAENEAARNFFASLASEQAQQVFIKYGFAIPE